MSRGELVEIGGAFRIPDVMARAGCRLVEVGTTNRTHLRDFEQAIGADTGAIMKVHTSNYVVEGFTAAVPETELAALARANHLPFVNDLGSGTLVDLERWGLPHEPTPREALAAGADLVTFSGDKLLGGPQCGIIVGRRDLIAQVNRNPMKRAMRLGKITVAALEAVLRLYANPEQLPEHLPALGLLTRSAEEIRSVAARIATALDSRLRTDLGDDVTVEVVPCRSQIGSGALPVDLLESAAVAVRLSADSRRSGGWLERLAASFRRLPVPVIGRIRDEAFSLDLRCLDDEPGFVGQLALLEIPAVEIRMGRGRDQDPDPDKGQGGC